MKRQIVLVLLVPILALTLISCDGDVSSGFAKFLGNFGGNVYIDGGLVEANKADVKAATATIAGLGSGDNQKPLVVDEETGKANPLGVDIDPQGVTSIMAPQSQTDQNKLKSDLANTLNSTQQTAELKKELEKKVEDTERVKAVQDTVKVFNATIEVLATQVTDPKLQEALGNLALTSIGSDGTVTEGEVLLVQMMTNMVSNTIETLESIKGDGGKLGDNLGSDMGKLVSIFDDALFTAKVASDLVGISDLDLLDGLDLSSFFNDDSKGSRGSDYEIDLEDAGDYLSIINTIGPKLVRLFDLKLSGGSYDWKTGGYRRLLSNFQAYRLSLEHALAFYTAGGIGSTDISSATLRRIDETTPVFYLLSVIITEADAFDSDFGKSFIPAFMNANKGLAGGTLKTTDMITFEITAGENNFDNFRKWLKDERKKDYVKALFENTRLLDEIGGSGYIEDGLDEFLNVIPDGETQTEFDKFWADLSKGV